MSILELLPITEERPLQHNSALVEEEYFNNLVIVFLNILTKGKKATQTE